MKRFWLLAFVLLCICGCATDGDKAQWDEFWKDLRGDNMKMSNNFGGTNGDQSSLSSSGSR